MEYLFIFIFIFVISILLIHLRIKFKFGTGDKLLFIGLGQSGPELDFETKKARIKLFGVKLITINFSKGKPETDKKSEKSKPGKPSRQRSLKEIIRVIPSVSKSLLFYSGSMLRAVIIEEITADLEIGFESPDITGRMFGYYQAVSAALPQAVGIISVTPNWNEACFKGNVKGIVSIPVYRIVFSTIALIFNLPLKDILKLAIGKKERSQR